MAIVYLIRWCCGARLFDRRRCRRALPAVDNPEMALALASCRRRFGNSARVPRALVLGAGEGFRTRKPPNLATARSGIEGSGFRVPASGWPASSGETATSLIARESTANGMQPVGTRRAVSQTGCASIHVHRSQVDRRRQRTRQLPQPIEDRLRHARAHRALDDVSQARLRRSCSPSWRHAARGERRIRWRPGRNGNEPYWARRASSASSGRDAIPGGSDGEPCGRGVRTEEDALPHWPSGLAGPASGCFRHRYGRGAYSHLTGGFTSSAGVGPENGCRFRKGPS